MEYIFFEKQEAALCAQHALNMLLQGDYFSASELAEIARRLDREENGVLEASSQNAKSVNMDDSGYFSIQVVSEALKPFSLDLIGIDHPSVASVKANPLTAKAFICNQSEHWFTLRKFGAQWFALNSVKAGPELLSDTYISLYLHQLQQEGYSIFVVCGILPDSEADRVISLCPVEPPPRPAKKEEKKGMIGGIGRRLGSLVDDISSKVMGGPADDESDFQKAIRLSLQNDQPGVDVDTSSLTDEDRQLQEALRLSMAGNVGASAGTEHQDSELQMALAKSMDTSESVQVRHVPIQVLNAPSTSNGLTEAELAERVRLQREAFLNRFQ